MVGCSEGKRFCLRFYVNIDFLIANGIALSASSPKSRKASLPLRNVREIKSVVETLHGNVSSHLWAGINFMLALHL